MRIFVSCIVASIENVEIGSPLSNRPIVGPIIIRGRNYQVSVIGGDCALARSKGQRKQYRNPNSGRGGFHETRSAGLLAKTQ